jgi:hypothetical protein
MDFGRKLGVAAINSMCRKLLPTCLPSASCVRHNTNHTLKTETL